MINIVKVTPNKNSLGFDEILVKLSKEVIYEIAITLTYLINKSFQDGIFPDDLKIARIVPIYKRGDKKSTSKL